MKKKFLIVGSGGNLGKYFFNQIKKTNPVIGLERKKAKNIYSCTDLSNYNLNLAAFKTIKKKNKKLDVIIICSGSSRKDMKQNFDDKFLSSFKSNFLTIANTIESYKKIYNNKPTNIIVISSIAALKIINAPVEYSVSKLALNYFCKIKAKELSKFKIKLNIVSPGNIMNKNNVWYLKMRNNPKKIKNYLKKNVPLNSFCKPKDILALCKLLVSREGSFFQGSNIVIDGGQIL